MHRKGQHRKGMWAVVSRLWFLCSGVLHSNLTNSPFPSFESFLNC